MYARIFLLLCLFYFGVSDHVGSQRRRHSLNMYNATTLVHNAQNGLLERIYERINTLNTVYEHQVKRLEALEYKLTRSEVTNQEQLNSLLDEVGELKKQAQNLDWLTMRADGSLEELKTNVNALRYDLSTRERRQQSPQYSTELDCSDKLTAVATLLTSTRAGVHKLEKGINVTAENITELLQYTRSILGAIIQRSPQSNLPALLPYAVSCSHTSSVSSGIHKIQIDPTRGSFFVMCDGTTQGGGWTVIQHRRNGLVNFNRNWLEYKHGFGNIAGEFFIGLDKLHDMTNAMLHELLIVLEDFDGVVKYAKYNAFAIGGEEQDYPLSVLGEYEGDAGDSLTYSASYKFSTFDNDNDGWVEGNCALSHTGAWWYNACEMSNLNGQYLGGDISDTHQYQGIYWNDFRGPKYSLKTVTMMIRPIEKIFTPNIN